MSHRINSITVAPRSAAAPEAFTGVVVCECGWEAKNHGFNREDIASVLNRTHYAHATTSSTLPTPLPTTPPLHSLFKFYVRKARSTSPSWVGTVTCDDCGWSNTYTNNDKEALTSALSHVSVDHEKIMTPYAKPSPNPHASRTVHIDETVPGASSHGFDGTVRCGGCDWEQYDRHPVRATLSVMLDIAHTKHMRSLDDHADHVHFAPEPQPTTINLADYPHIGS